MGSKQFVGRQSTFANDYFNASTSIGYLRHLRLEEHQAADESALALSKRPNRRSCGQSVAAASTTNSVPMPPTTTEIWGLVSQAKSPDSKPPNSFEAPMNMLL